MKSISLRGKIKFTLFTITFTLLSALHSFGATYTAMASGNWSSSATWIGGVAPSFTLTSDIVVIPSGITVTMDGNVDVSSLLASIQVAGTLSSTASYSLTVGSLGTVSGAGTLNIGTLDLQTGSTFTFSGNATVDTLSTAVASLQLASQITVTQALDLSAGTLNVPTGSSITMGSGSTINISGGILTVGSNGILGLTSSYNVAYSQTSVTTGVELTGSGLQNVTVAVSGGNTVTLASNLVVNGSLSLTSGSLVVGANNLTLNGAVAEGGSGTITSTALSSITINSSGGTVGLLSFAGSSSVGTLTINVGAGDQAMIGGSLDVTGTLALTSGSLNFSNTSLSIGGTISGSGNLIGNAASNLSITAAGGISSGLNFAAGGQSLNNLTINVGAGNTVVLGSNLNIAGNLDIASGNTLNISGDTVAVGGNLMGTGAIMANSSSGLAFNASESLTSALNITGTGIGALIVNIGNGNTASLAGNITVTGMLDLQSGILNLNGYNLTISGMVSGSGNVFSTAASNIAINTTGGIGGTLNFANNSSSGNLTINVGAWNQAQIGGSLDVTGTLALTSGWLNLGSSNLTISGSVTGSGMFYGTGSSNLTVNTSGGLNGSLNFVPGWQVLNNFTVNVGSGNSVMLGSDLAIGGTLTLTGGSSLNIGGDTLWLNGQLSGTGTLSVDSTTTVIITSGNLAGTVSLSGTVGNFVVNVGAGNTVTLGSNLSVSNTISLQTGALALNGFNLNLMGDIAAGGSGTISSGTSSNITINTVISPSGGLTFTAGANSAGNLSVSTGGNLMIGSSLNVSGMLGLNGGTIDIGNDTLNILGSGSISGGGSLAYIIASGSGALGLQLTSGDTAWADFMIGTSANFAPVAVQLNSGSSGGTFYASVNSGVFAQGTGGINLSANQPGVNVTWMVESSININVNVNLMTMWSSSMEVNGFNHDSAYLSHFTNGAWDISAITSASAQGGGMFSIERPGITSFSPFAVFGKGAVTTSIPEVNNGGFEIYPNPVSDNLIIKNTGNIDNLNIEIMNIDGQVIANYKVTDYTTNIPLSTLSAGNYFVKLYNDNTNVVKPFVKM